MLLWSTVLVRSAIRLYVCFTNHCAGRIDIGPIAHTVSDILIRNRARASAVPDRTLSTYLWNLFLSFLPWLASVFARNHRGSPRLLLHTAFSVFLSLPLSLPPSPSIFLYLPWVARIALNSICRHGMLSPLRERNRERTRRRIVACTSSRIVTRIYLHDNGAHG